ncbi:MAG: hypothetical protein ISR65_10945 [Bacteriovoracaceae bacterium]|nr:hypothetical protein [Bacteriovoracaceae bacterium]
MTSIQKPVSAQRQALLAQFHFLAAIRNFFNKSDFIDVLTPPMVENPGMETHIHPYKVIDSKWYLHTSPEFHMKQLLSLGFEKIFTLSYCFRNEGTIDSDHHRHQFIMLEWYRANSTYEKIMDDCEQLFVHCQDYLANKGIGMRDEFKNATLTRMSVQELFFKFLQIDILEYLEIDSISKLIKDKFCDIPLPKSNETDMEWDDYYFLLFLNKIEPKLKQFPYLLLYEFPYHLSALSTLKKEDPRVCQRFEIYVAGVEICNCFNELCDLKTQRNRFEMQSALKKKLYHYCLPEPTILYEALERGINSPSGIALGVERLLMALTTIEHPFWSKL